MMIEPVSAQSVPPPGGHYSQAIIAGDMIHVSGQLPIAAPGQPPVGDFTDQARLAITNMLAIVDAAGGDIGTVVKVNAYIVGIANWPPFNTLFAEIFGEARPARAVIPVPELHYGCMVEVDCVAVRRDAVAKR